MYAPRLAESRGVEISVRESSFLWHLDGKSRAALAAAALQDALAARRARTQAKAVRPRAFTLLRLVRSLHGDTLYPILKKNQPLYFFKILIPMLYTAQK